MYKFLSKDDNKLIKELKDLYDMVYPDIEMVRFSVMYTKIVTCINLK